jgi:hypothetical protein
MLDASLFVAYAMDELVSDVRIFAEHGILHEIKQAGVVSTCLSVCG